MSSLAAWQFTSSDSWVRVWETLKLQPLLWFLIYIGYSYITDPNWCLLLESIEAITGTLTITSIMNYAAQLGTKSTLASVQGCIATSYYGLGKEKAARLLDKTVFIYSISTHRLCLYGLLPFFFMYWCRRWCCWQLCYQLHYPSVRSAIDFPHSGPNCFHHRFHLLSLQYFLHSS